MNETGNLGHTPAPLRPIPRTGLRGTAGLFLYILLALAAATIGIGVCAFRTDSPMLVNVSEAVSGVSLVLLTVHLWRVSRRAKGIIPLLVMAAVFLVFLTGSLIPAGILLSLVFAVGEGSLLLAVVPGKQAVYLPLIPILAFTVTAVLMRDLVGAATVLLPFPAMLVLAVGTRSSAAREDGLTRVGALCATSLVLGLSAVALAALMAYDALGSLSLSVLTEALESIRTAAIEAVISVEVPEGLEELVTRESAESMINGTINLLPGYLVVVVNILVTVAQFIQHAGLVAFGFGESVTDRVRVFRMSLVSCIVFVVAYIVVIVTTGDSSTVASTVAHNIYIVLLPGLSFAGLLRTVSGMVRKGPGGAGCLAFLLPVAFLLVPFALAVVEVIGQVMALIASRKKPPEDPFR